MKGILYLVALVLGVALFVLGPIFGPEAIQRLRRERAKKWTVTAAYCSGGSVQEQRRNKDLTPLKLVAAFSYAVSGEQYHAKYEEPLLSG